MFSQDFKRCIYYPKSIEEFESSWKDLLDYYDLTENDWLKDLYELREKWAQIYGWSNFCAGMTTSFFVQLFLFSYFVTSLIKHTGVCTLSIN